jgi:transaldolase
MPEETIAAFQDHGHIEARLETELDAAQHLLRELSAAGIDYNDVVATLEREGIEKFVAAYGELLQSIAARRRVLAPAV